MEWLQAANEVIHRLSELFDDPNRSNVARTASAVDRAVAHLGQAIDQATAIDRTGRMRRALHCLHFLRTALMDNDSPLNG
jgi:hypothetical protein